MSDAQARLLVVDDDREIRELLARFLSKHGFAVDAAADGRELDRRLREKHYDLLILDIMLPGEDGLSICRRLRTQLSIPMIMLTAVGDETDRIVGLELGADDYLAKPFNPRELLARIKAVLRRAQAHTPPLKELPSPASMQFDGFSLDVDKRELRDRSGQAVPLTTGEFCLLVVFLQHPQRVLNRDQLLDLTKGREAGPFDRSVDVQLSRLRKKIEDDPKNPQRIKTVRGGGYLFTAKVALK